MGKHYRLNAHAVRWTRLAYSCYQRGCRCTNCDLIPEDFIKQCRVKSSVIELVCKFGVPNKNSVPFNKEMTVEDETTEREERCHS